MSNYTPEAIAELSIAKNICDWGDYVNSLPEEDKEAFKFLGWDISYYQLSEINL